MSDPRETIAKRFREADIDTERFIQCRDGEKASIDHTNLPPEKVSGNYGIYATEDDTLVILDIDDYGDLKDTSGLSALANLPPTFEQQSPHGGTHRIYAVHVDIDGGEISDVLADDSIGKKNPKPSWGEVRVANQYVVGAGSQLDGCDKDWCDECATADGGRYTINADREIAEISADQLLSVLHKDPNYVPDDDDDQVGQDIPDVDADHEETLAFALKDSNDAKLRRLWNGDYSDYGGDRSEAECALAYKLGWWLQGDKRAVEQAMDGHGLPAGVSPPSLQKWGEREDDTYRNSVLEAVDEVTDYYSPSKSGRQPDPDPDEFAVKGDDGEERELPQPNRHFAVNNGGYGVWTQNDEGGRFWTEWTNFQLELNSTIITPKGDQVMSVTVHPRSEDTYDIEVEPTVFNERRSFKKHVCIGRTTTFAGSDTDLTRIKQFVGSQDAPTKVGTTHMGYHGDVFVTPNGNLSSDGWVDEAETVYLESEIGAERKWSLSPDDGDDVDREAVGEMLELLANSRKKERLLPLLGWFYSAPLRPLILEWTGQFNLMSVTGETGSGKTTTIETFWELMGMDGEPMSANTTEFVLLSTLASTNSIPMWFDEYKPSDMSKKAINRFLNEVRKTTKGGIGQRGNADKSTDDYHLHAPVVVSGEERIRGSAEERRGIFTTFRKDSTLEGSDTAVNFAKLTGGAEKVDGEIQYFEGYDLKEHALAFIQWLLNYESDDLRQWWRQAGEHVDELLQDIEVSLREGLVKQGLQTTKFGCTIFRAFANDCGVDSDIVTTDEIDRAIIYTVSGSTGGANRQSHLDILFDVAGRAAKADYLREGEHYRFVNEDQDDEELRINLATSFDQIRRFARDHEVSEDLLNNKHDYDDRLRNEMDSTPYIVTRSQWTTDIGSAVGLHVATAGAELNGFGKWLFDESTDGARESKWQTLDTDAMGRINITVTCTHSETSDVPDSMAEKGTLEDSTKAMDYVVWQRNRGDIPQLEEGRHYAIKGAKLGEHGGAPQIVLDEGVSEVRETQAGFENIPPADSGMNETIDTAAATDGGEEFEQNAPKIREIVAETEPCSDVEVKGMVMTRDLDMTPEEVDSALDDLLAKGRITRTPDGNLEVV